MRINTTPPILQKGNAVSEYDGLCLIGGRAEASVFTPQCTGLCTLGLSFSGNSQGQGPGFVSRLCALGKLISLYSGLLSVRWDDDNNGT